MLLITLIFILSYTALITRFGRDLSVFGSRSFWMPVILVVFPFTGVYGIIVLSLYILSKHKALAEWSPR